jgi:pyrimidine operon attenuation protein/uracil phosphoribosyltransferase
LAHEAPNDAPDRPAAGSSRAAGSEHSSSSSSSRSKRDAGGDGGARVVLDDLGVRRAVMRIAHEIVEQHGDLGRVYVVAVPRGGVPLGRLLVEDLRQVAGREVPLGFLDTTLYRDDLVTSGERPPLRETEMPSSVDDRIVILVEDVVNTGRTIRAAMDALMDFGRPRAVQVVSLVDRGHRELPIKIDYVGKNIPTQPEEKVTLRVEDRDAGGALEVVVEAPRAGGDHEGGEG